jgi:16S rRNA (cytosine967-C5)-methyltransferase
LLKNIFKQESIFYLTDYKSNNTMNDTLVTENNDASPFFSGVRASAIRILSRFERSDAYLDKLIDSELSSGDMSQLDKALLTEIINGVIRWRWKLDWGLTGFYHGDYLKCLNIVKNAMRVAFYQIMFLQKVPDYAAINESVEVVKRLQGEKTAGIVNGVLRNLARNIDNIRYPKRHNDPIYYLSVMESHPRWLVRRWVEQFGEQDAEIILQANNRRPYLPVRLNTLRSNSEEVEQFFLDNDIRFIKSEYTDRSYILKSPGMNIANTELFKSGKITIQDPSATMAAILASPKPGMNVIDLCSAPGGKSFMLAEQMQDEGKVVAIDKYESKLRFIEQGKERMGYEIITPFVSEAEKLVIENPADIVFADVPCSGLGTLSKKPDIKWKRERDDLYNLSKIQRQIMASAAKLLNSGGVFVYSTCTIEPEENMENVAWFLENYPEFEIDPAENYLPEKVCKDGAMQTFQHLHYIDGAFAMRFVKK